ncbi:MAG: hypothetical protein WC509_03165 [Candidatus Izemoplasmatales bacterium]
MNDLYLKGIVSIAALYAAANPWFRHHNVARPGDLGAALLIFVYTLFAIGTDPGAVFWFVVAGAVAAALAVRLVALSTHKTALVVFGCGRRNRDRIQALVKEIGGQFGIVPSAIRFDLRLPWLIRFEGVAPKLIRRFEKEFDKGLRPALGLEFRRLYPASLLVLAFLAFVWRYL